jgi:hypothetical protein
VSMLRPSRRLPAALSVAAVLFVATSGRTAAQSSPQHAAALQRILVAEDARGHGPDSIQPLLDGLADPDSLLRRVAVRGVGRLQRPDLVPRLVAALADTLPAVRAEAANAIAQSVGHLRGAPASDAGRASAAEGQRALLGALAGERSADVADALAEAIGRLPFADSASARSAERQIRERLETKPGVGAFRGLYTLALARRLMGDLAP